MPCHGYRADAVVAGLGPMMPVLVDGGPPGGVDPARHRRRMPRRCALLGGDADAAVRIPSWKLIEGAEIELQSHRV